MGEELDYDPQQPSLKNDSDSIVYSPTRGFGQEVDDSIEEDPGVIGILSTCAAFDGCDDQLFPSSFRALEHDLGFTPKDLGICSLSQTLAFALFSPMWARLAEEFPRRWMLGIGCGLWGFCTIALAVASDFWLIVVFRGINGIALASVGPIATAALSEITREERRGWVFSLVQSSKNTGRLVGGFVTTSLALQVFCGVSGWRIAFLFVGISSLLLALWVIVALKDTPAFNRCKSNKRDARNGIGAHQDETVALYAAPVRSLSRRSSISGPSASLYGPRGDVVTSSRAALHADRAFHRLGFAPVVNPFSDDITAPTEQTPLNLYAVNDPNSINNNGSNVESPYGATTRLDTPLVRRQQQQHFLSENELGVPPVPADFVPEWQFSDLMEFLKLPSVFTIGIVELFVGIPWGALTFCTLWLQYLGLSDSHAALVVACQLLSIIAFSPIAGKLSDKANIAIPSAGRASVAQIATLLRLPSVLLLFLWAPSALYTPTISSNQLVGVNPGDQNNLSIPAGENPGDNLNAILGLNTAEGHLFALCVLCVISGSFAALSGATNRPLVTELVGPTYRTSALAWIDCLEICVRAVLGAPMVGILAEVWFGFTPSSLRISEMDENLRKNNARALGQALCLCVVFPLIGALISYTPLHYTLQRDKEKAYVIYAKQVRRAWIKFYLTSGVNSRVAESVAQSDAGLYQNNVRSTNNGLMQSITSSYIRQMSGSSFADEGQLEEEGDRFSANDEDEVNRKMIQQQVIL